MINKFKYLYLSLLCFVISCGEVSSQLHSIESAESIKQIVLMGGNGSCFLGGYPAELKMWPKLEKSLLDKKSKEDREGVVVIRTCFGMGGRRVFYDKLKYRDNTFVSAVSAQQTTYKKWPEVISELVDSDKPTLMIGQSYGGYLAMQSVLKAETLPTVLTLVTLDPISIHECQIPNFMVNLLVAGEECRRFPADIIASTPDIRAKTRYWLNIYQDDFTALHSGPAEHADENKHLHFSQQGMHPMGAHALTETDARIWESISSLL